MPTPQRRVSIFIFDEVEVLDFCGPFEVFSVTGRQRDDHPFEVRLVAETLQPVIARGGLSVNPHYGFASAPAADILLIPGGWGTRPLLHWPTVIEWIARQAEQASLVLSVCTGALLLGKAGLLDGLTVTTHWRALDLLQETAPGASVVEDRRFVDNGRVVTSAGISAGIDMSLHIVARLLGSAEAEETARYMQYDWRPAVTE